MNDWQWLIDTFTFIGMAVSIIITLIAVVWLTCFFVRLLVKTFNVRVGKSYELMVEDIEKKSAAKKERNELKRKQSFENKMEILNMKLESKQRIHEMKKAKLDDKLTIKENRKKVQIFGEEAADIEIPEVKIEKPAKVENKVEVVEKEEKPAKPKKQQKAKKEEPVIDEDVVEAETETTETEVETVEE